MSENAPEKVQPQSVPQSITVGKVQGGGMTFVTLQIDGPTGTYVTFLDPDLAGKLAKRLADVAMHAQTGLVIAQGLGDLNGHPK